MDLADRVAVLREGRIEQIGTPAALDDRPASAFVFDFLGDANRLPCRLDGELARFDGFSVPAIFGPGAAGASVAWFRPHETELTEAGPGLAVTVVEVLVKGAMVRVECRADDGSLFEADFPRSAKPAAAVKGARVRLAPRRAFVFAEDAKLR